LARVRKTRTLLYEHLCFHAQQAAERATKAVLVHHGIQVPKSHDLAYLLDKLPDGVATPPILLKIPVLTKYAVQRRYPGERPPLESKHRRRAVRLAERTVAWASMETGEA